MFVEELVYRSLTCFVDGSTLSPCALPRRHEKWAARKIGLCSSEPSNEENHNRPIG
jgi:hypothetical protein